MSDTSQFLAMPDAAIDEADILLLPIPLERTVSFKPGTAEAPKAILDTTEQLEFYEEDAGWSPFKHMKLNVLPDFTDDRSLSDAEFHVKLTEYVALLPKGNLFIGLGGEHSLTPSLVEARMPEPGTVLFLDAHADMRTSYEGSKYSHACPVTRLLGQGHKIVMAGIRSIYESEVKVIEKNPNISLFLDWDLRGKGQWESFLQRVNSLEGPVYLSIDMDVFNPAAVPGVGTPQPGGFFWYQMIEVLETLFSKKEIDLRGVDMVEIVPEPSRVSEMTAAKLLLKIISFWGCAKEFNLKPEVGNQSQMDYE
ncbi:agmatinase [Deltaproteobacteria bacterium IMCC39524]|nr:agmatinase [Deltaproteobacteria bacterium IMCC39524]